MKKIKNLMVISISVVVFGCKNDSKTSINEPNVQNCSQSSHQDFVKSHFIDTGNDVYGISLIGNNGDCGFVYILNGYNRSKGLGFDCTVKTNGENGIQITDPGCDYKFY